jgi:peptide-methionine (S)-S-oxide reductase
MIDSISNNEAIVFGGGCFWCTEAVFQMLKGIVSAVPGYAGGEKPNPTYEDVSTGLTGHVEVVKIEYDPSQISFFDLLNVFFATHDPTTVNRQGNDVGTQYRSAIFYTTTEQKTEAEKFIADLNNSQTSGLPVVTEVLPLEKFYLAEDYHQEYYKHHKNDPYCDLVINPKLEKVQQKFATLLKESKK